MAGHFGIPLVVPGIIKPGSGIAATPPRLTGDERFCLHAQRIHAEDKTVRPFIHRIEDKGKSVAVPKIYVPLQRLNDVVVIAVTNRRKVKEMVVVKQPHFGLYFGWGGAVVNRETHPEIAGDFSALPGRLPQLPVNGKCFVRFPNPYPEVLLLIK